jgi:hypothetical protein
MKKIALIIVAAAAVFAAVPASAQSVVIRDGAAGVRVGAGPGYYHRDRAYRSRAQYRPYYGRRHYRRGPAIVIRP